MTSAMLEADKRRIEEDARAPRGVSKGERTIDEAMLIAILDNDKLTPQERETYIDDLLKVKPKDKPDVTAMDTEGTGSSDGQQDSSKKIAPSLESAIPLAVQVAIDTFAGLSPEIRELAKSAGKELLPFVTGESTTPTTASTGGELAINGNNQNPAEQDPNKTVAKEAAPAAAPVADTGEAERKKLQEKKKLAQQAQDIVQSTDPMKATVDAMVAAGNGMRNLDEAGVKEVATKGINNVTADHLRHKVNGDPALADKVAQNSPANTAALVIGNRSLKDTGELIPLSTAGKGPATSNSRSTS
ncbi:MAG: hypothetical protein KGJ06_08830 [Pseudomonadota bacterium]|nr:hypothetical protein [Pseudomonadota bacterium]